MGSSRGHWIAVDDNGAQKISRKNLWVGSLVGAITRAGLIVLDVNCIRDTVGAIVLLNRDDEILELLLAVDIEDSGPNGKVVTGRYSVTGIEVNPLYASQVSFMGLTDGV